MSQLTYSFSTEALFNVSYWTYLGYSALAFWLLWVFFLAVMKLDEEKHRMHGAVKVVGYFTLAVGLVIDFIVQVLPATILWLELPRELTVSGRVKRLCATGHGYRYNLAIWFRNHLLAPFDKSGGHGVVLGDSTKDSVR